MWHYRRVLALFQIVLRLLTDLAGIVPLAVRRHGTLAAEILMLRRQLALYVERGVKPRRIDPATRITLSLLSRFFKWRDALVVVRPETMLRWHRAGWRLLWRLKSRPGRPPIPEQVQALIRRMGSENPSWGEERIANELLLKLIDFGKSRSRHRREESYAVRAKSILGGLHHEYSFATVGA